MQTKEDSMSTQVSKPLTLIMDVKSPEDYEALKGLIAQNQEKITKELNDIKTVHFARFVFLSDNKQMAVNANPQLAIITSYDGNFSQYITAFTERLGDIFDALMKHMKNPPKLPVACHKEDFENYIMRNDKSAVDGQPGSLYSAYPNLTVRDILALEQRKQGEKG